MSPRRSLFIVGAVLGSLGLGGCSYLSPQTTASPYAPSDGVQADVNNIGVRNIMIVAGKKDAPGQFYGSVVNSGTTAAEVTFTSEAGAIPSITIPAGQIVQLKTKNLRVAKVPVFPGETIPLTVGANGSTAKLAVPVLDGKLPEYRTLVPSASGSAKPTPSASPSSTTNTSS